MFSWVVNPSGINESSNLSTEEEEQFVVGVRRGKTGICTPLEIGTKNQNFPKILTSAAQFRLIDLFLAMTLYLPQLHSHCTRQRQQGSCNSPEIFKSFFKC